ncbi:MAG: Os1348 family NHLP clan protein [Caldilineales bacterium]
MTRRAVEAIIGKAALDEEFRNALFADPDTILTGFPLTRTERVALMAIDSESLEFFATSPGVLMAQSLLLQLNTHEGIMPRD